MLKSIFDNSKISKIPDTVRVAFRELYPDQSGYTFYSINVWDGNFNVMNSEHPGWRADMRIMEARYVIFGRIIYSVTDCAELNGNNKHYNDILNNAKELSNIWGEEFLDFQQKYRHFWIENPQAHGCRWNQETKQVYE